MKAILTLFVLMTGWVAATAQYVPATNQSQQFLSLYNPAFAGIERFSDLKLGYRYQFAGFGGNAPKFLNAAFNFRIKQPLDAEYNALRTSAAEGSGESLQGRFIHAAGVNVFDEETGIVSRTGGGLTYSLHFTASRQIHIAAGFSVVAQNTRLNVNAIYLGMNPDSDPLYDQMLRDGSNRTDLNGRVGIVVYSQRFYVGGSYLHAFDKVLSGNSAVFAPLTYRATAQMGTSFPVSAGVDLKPAIYALMKMDNEWLIDYSLKVFLHQKIWFGGMYRSVQSAVGMVGLPVSKAIAVSYSYEMSTSGMKQFNDGTHELVLGLKLNNYRNRDAYVW